MKYEDIEEIFAIAMRFKYTYQQKSPTDLFKYEKYKGTESYDMRIKNYRIIISDCLEYVIVAHIIIAIIDESSKNLYRQMEFIGTATDIENFVEEMKEPNLNL